MVAGRITLLLVLLLAASYPALLANVCPPSDSRVRLSASSYENTTGHWTTKVALTLARDVGKLQREERHFHFDVDITRQVCDDKETVTTAFTVVGAAPSARVGAGYKFFPGVGFYKLHMEKMNWENARRTCEKEKAHLAIVNSEEEEKAISQMMTNHSTKIIAAFIGFHDMFKEGEYVTIHGDTLESTGRVRWATGQPDNTVYPDSPEGEDCGEIRNDGTINDVQCSIEMPFVCEVEL